MKNLKLKDVERFVETHIDEFHSNRLAQIRKLKLLDVMSRKNPYLFKAKYLLSADAIVKTLVNAHISSSEETTFGEFLEKLAIFICGKIYNGQKSSTEGIDLEFNRDGNRYIVYPSV